MTTDTKTDSTTILADLQGVMKLTKAQIETATGLFQRMNARQLDVDPAVFTMFGVLLGAAKNEAKRSSGTDSAEEKIRTTDTKTDPTTIIADLKQRLAKAKSALELVFRLAAFFQDDYSTKLPVIAAFRRWRGGQLSTEAFLKRLGEDDLSELLRYEPVPPMEGLALLNDRRR